MQKRLGVLALQGDFAAHQQLLLKAGYAVVLIRSVADCHDLDGLVLPGGESTTMIKLLQSRGLWSVLDQQVRAGLKVMTTCAGTILAATQVSNPAQPSFAWLPISVVRNAYGDQRFSFTATATFQQRPLQLVFIRAPQIIEVDQSVTVHMTQHNQPVLVEYKNILAATFHPEMANDDRLYRYWFMDSKKPIS